MQFKVPDDAQGEEVWPSGDSDHFIYVPLAWRTDQDQFDAPAGAGGEIEDALKCLHTFYLDLPVPDRLLDLVRPRNG